MLDADNPSTPDSTTPANSPSEAAAPQVDGAPAAKKAAKKAPAKKAAKKATAKKAAKSAESPDVPLDGAEGTGGAESATAPKKRPAKKTAKKAAAKAEATPDAGSGDAQAGDGGSSARPVGAPMVLFQAPEKTAPVRKRAAKKTAAQDAPESETVAPGDEPSARPAKKTAKKTAPKTAKKAAPKGDAEGASDEPTDTEGDDASTGDGDADGGEGGARRRRRRGGRRRRKGAGEDGAETDVQDDSGAASDDEGEDGEAGSRRRRTRVRQPRNPEDEITSIGGSTRLEAKKQRRREGREAGRRRAPIVSEAEFLARREAVDRVMVIRQRADLTQIAVLEDKVLVEHYASRDSQTSLIGNIYLGRVQNVLPSMEAAFIDIGKGRNAVLYAGEVNWAALGHKDGQARKVESVLKSGQTILVQVTKDPVGHKGARLTGQISLPGRFLVYVPDGNTSGISRKLPDTERNRLKTVLKEIVPNTAGVIVRTAAEGASEEELTQDVERLTVRWAEIEKAVAAGRSPELLYGEPDLTLKVVRDLFTEDFSSLVIEGNDAWDLVDGYVSQVAPDLRDRLKRYESADGKDIFAAHRIDEQIAKGLDRKVWLPSGGSLVIDRTEAMTVVDVNTGKFTGSGGNLEETVTKNNLEAAEEMVRQLRLRDIGGIIVIDFIDMVLESNRDLVLRRLVECLGRDRTRHQVAEVTSLGLVQMTRKRIGSGLIETFSEDCDHCKGRGVIVHEQPIEPSNRSVGMGGGMGGGSGGGSGGGTGGGGGGSNEESRGRRNRGGRGRNRSGSDEGTPQPDSGKPSPMALAGSKPHPESEIIADDDQAPEVVAPVETPAEPSSGAPVADAVVPKGAAGDSEGESVVEVPADRQAAETVAPVVVTSTRRRRAGRPAGPAVVAPEAGPEAGPESTPESAPESEAPAVAPATETDPESGHVPITDDPVELAESGEPVEDPAETEPDEGSETDESAAGDAAPIFHVPVKKKGSRKR